MISNRQSQNCAAFVVSCAVLLIVLASADAANTNANRPNVLFILADDLGYGDVQAYGKAMVTTSIVPTPRMDALAAQGMMFTQMHSCSALCSPSRYGILTGRYSWRLKSDGVLPGGVVGSYGQPIIRQGELTLARFLKNQGYDTAGFGKWHLGTQWYDRQGQPFRGNAQIITNAAQIDLARRLEGHAIDQGFNHFFGAVGALGGGPFAYVVDDRVQFNGKPATPDTPWKLMPARDFTPGTNAKDSLADPSLTQMNFGPEMISRATNYLATRAKDAQPFFAYVALYSPHLPNLATPKFVGASGKSGFPYGDYVAQTDHWIGQLIDALGLSASNTIVIGTSDNGPEGISYVQGLRHEHDSNGPFKGVKRDSWEGGHRIPFIIRWPGKIAAGKRTDALHWQGDFFATIAQQLKATIPTGQAQDSESFLATLLDRPSHRAKPVVLASGPNQLSIHTADGWKLIDGTRGGGAVVSHNADNVRINQARGTIGGSPKQLYHLPSDIGERTNVFATKPDKADELMKQLEATRNSGTNQWSTPPVRNSRTPSEDAED